MLLLPFYWSEILAFLVSLQTKDRLEQVLGPEANVATRLYAVRTSYVARTLDWIFLCMHKALFTALVTYPVSPLLLNRILYLGTFPMSAETKYCH